MAIIQLSGIGITEIRNKLGAQVFTRNRAGQIARAWVSPANTASAARTNTRNNFATCYSLWPLVTDDEFEQWKIFGTRFTKRNSIAQAYSPTARNIFVACNMNMLIALQLPISAPVFNALPVPVSSSAVSVLSVSDIYISPFFLGTGSITPANCICVVSASPSISAGIHYPRQNFLPISVIAPGVDVSAYSFFAEYFAAFGAPVVAKRVMFKLSLIHALSGVRSKIIMCSGVVS